MKNILLMTATISPYKDVPVLKVTNYLVRLKHYQDALEKYICFSCFDDIVLVDNSNYPFERKKYEKLAEEHGKRFEYITYVGNKEKMVRCGKSYGEGEIIEYALKNSKLMKNEKYFFKVSGRYYLINNKNILKNLNRKYDYFAPWNYKLIKQRGIDTVFFGCKIEDWRRYFEGKYEKANDAHGYAFEHIVYQVIHENVILYRYFPVSPQYDVPVQASTGKKPVYKAWKEMYKRIYIFWKNFLLWLKEIIRRINR